MTNQEKVLLVFMSISLAAHCITGTNGHLQSPSNYIVAVGKSSRQFNDSQDSQYSTVHDMLIPRQYKGEVQHYFGDIAIIVTRDTLQLNQDVQPALLSTDEGVTNLNASVSSWNFFGKNSTKSNILKWTRVSTLSSSQCEARLDQDFKEYLTDDKFCARYLGTESLCNGSSGEGLLVEVEDQWHLVGVASISLMPQTDRLLCGDDQISLYTDVSYYVKSFIKNKLTEFA